ncbi:hypothetical protein D3C85_396970 [compost metagenome]
MPLRYDLPGLKAHRRDDAATRGAQHGVFEPVTREFELSRLGLGGCMRGLGIGMRALGVGRTDRAVSLQVGQALAVRVGLTRLLDGNRPLLSRRFLGEAVVAVIQHSQYVAFAHELAYLDLALSDLAAHAEGLVDFMPRLHGAHVSADVASIVVADFNGAYRSWCLHGRLIRTACAKHGGDGQNAGRSKGILQDGSSLENDRFLGKWWPVGFGGCGWVGGLFEHLPAPAQCLVELHAIEQQAGVAFVGIQACRQARPL